MELFCSNEGWLPRDMMSQEPSGSPSNRTQAACPALFITSLLTMSRGEPSDQPGEYRVTGFFWKPQLLLELAEGTTAQTLTCHTWSKVCSVEPQFVPNPTEYCCLEELGQISHGQHSFQTSSGNLGSKPSASVGHTGTEAREPRVQRSFPLPSSHPFQAQCPRQTLRGRLLGN